jgi:hypothetical protein
MEAQLLIKFLIDDAAMEKRTKTDIQIAQHGKLLNRSENLADRSRQLLPSVLLNFQLFLATLCQLVVFGTPVIV